MPQYIDRIEVLNAIHRLSGTKDDIKMIETLVDEYFDIIHHMKETSLYEVFEYESKITKAIIEPMRIFATENEELKKEVNKLRMKLKKTEKYKVVY